MLVGLRSRRSKLEIHLEILKVIKNGTEKPTRIMYETNLLWKPFQGILSYLMSQSLVDEIDVSGSGDKRTNTAYRLTERGEVVLRYFEQAGWLLGLDKPETVKVY